MEYILLPLLERLSEGMPELMLVDEDYGQLEVVDEEGKEMYPITYPAVLLDLEQVDWEGVQGRSQYGTARLKARLVIDCYDDTHMGSATSERIRERAELRERMHELLQGFKVAEEASALMRIESKFYTGNHGIKVYQETYTCRVVELLTRQRAALPSRPKISLSVSSVVESQRTP